MLRLASGTTLVLTVVFSMATMGLSREWKTPVLLNDDWQIVFNWYGVAGGSVTHVMNLDGSDVQRLMLNGDRAISDADCSPNGDSLGLVTGSAVYVVAPDSAEPRQVQPVPAGADWFSIANGGTAAIVGGANGSTYLVEVSEWREVTRRLPSDHTGSRIQFDLSPDGRRIAYQTNALNVFVVGADGTVLAALTGGVYLPDWSPEGYLAFAAQWDGRSNIYLMDVDRSTIVQLSHVADGFGNTFPSWSPDGSHILYVYYANRDSADGELYVMNADGSEQRPFTDPATRLNSACILTVRPASLVAGS
jgi:Tol biopolymer transport system component